MAQTTYRQQQPTLDELLMARGQSAPAASAAQDGQQNFSDSGEQRLYQMLSQSQDQGPEPTVEKRSVTGSIFRALGDAISTYASIMGHTSGLETHSFQKYLDQLEGQKADKQAFDEKRARADQEAKLRGAEFLYTAGERKAQREDQQAAARDLKQLTLSAQEADRKQRAQEAQAGREADAAKFERTKAWDLEMEGARTKRETAIANIHKRGAEGDEIAKNDQKKLPEIIANIGGLAEAAKERLAAGDTPEQMQTRVRRMLDAALLSPEARKAAEHYYNEEMGPILRDYQEQKQNAELGAGSPDANMGGPDNPILQRLGSVRTPQRY